MFEVGFSELLLIMGLALLVLGPEKLPKVVGEIGRWMGRARAMARQFREQLEIEAQETARRQSQQTSSTNPTSRPRLIRLTLPRATVPTLPRRRRPLPSKTMSTAIRMTLRADE